VSVSVFENKEHEYQTWIRANPDGYVLTTVSQVSTAYMSLHRANCRMISKYMKNMAPDAFTGRGYIKICSRDSAELSTWIRRHGGEGFTKLCSRCAPEVREGVADEADAYYSKLALEVATSRNDAVGRCARLAVASREAEIFTVTTTVFRRNPDVIAEVLERANGVCQRCQEAAPFRRASDSSPYLEVHHTIPLADGGDDAVDNALALCPNCHREMHYGATLDA
jgi:5-methylcytosine-specific restriction endonuclease McrA